MIKNQLLNHCQKQLNQRLIQLNELIQQVENSLQAESKSTAGDKHETGRAMLQLEREKLGFQLKEVEVQQFVLQNVIINSKTDFVSAGSLVKTTLAYYFIAISAAEFTVNNTNYYCISALSPIGKALKGKKVKDEFECNTQKGTILEIL